MNCKECSEEQENYIAKLLGGKVVAGSGAKPFNKGDVRVKDFLLVECKTQVKKAESYKIEKKIIDKVSEEAFGSNINNYAVAFNFGDNENNYFIVNQKFFKELFQCYKDINNDRL